MTRVTLVLPLKGRRLHTMRFFWHANRQSLPYRMIVADGQVERGIAERLSPPHALFPALDIDYVRCPDDTTYQHYFDKLAAAAGLVTTPYAMLCDNDDFVVRAGVDACAEFLDDHRDYAGISGGVAGFALHDDDALPKVAGVIRSLGSMYHGGYCAEEYAAPHFIDRVRQNFARGYSLYYSVFRTEVLAAVLTDMAEIGFSDLKAAETFFGARIKTLGKCRLDRRVISYVRQQGTSSGAPDVWNLDDVHGSGARAAEVERCIAALARPIAAADGINAAAELRALFVDEFEALVAESGPWETGRRDVLRETLRAIVPRPVIDTRRRMVRRRARDELARSMRLHGAHFGDIALMRRELLDIETTLEGPELPAFMREHAADLLETRPGDASSAPEIVAANVSVVIPAYRAAATIGQAVRSCLADAAVAEVIVVLDGPDEALRAALPDDVRLRILEYAQNRGAPAARNAGLAAARGEFVMFLDADDFVEGGLVTSLAQEARNADIAFGSYAFAFPSGRRIAMDVHRTIGAPTVINVLKAWFNGDYVPPCAVLWRKSFAVAIGGWNEGILKNQDGELVWRACRAVPRIALGMAGQGIYMQSPSPHRVSRNQSLAVYEQQLALIVQTESELAPEELPELSASLGAMYYRVARSAYYHGAMDVGMRAERAARCHGAVSAGTLSHRLLSRLLGLRRKEQLCAQLHRARRALGLVPAPRDLLPAE